MGFRIVEDISEANAITHGGTIHADEVLASVVLSRVMDVRLARVFEVPPDLPEDVVVYDIGLGKFDHHQSDKATRGNGFPYAAFGLIWREYGKRYLSQLHCPDSFLNRIFTSVDKKVVTGIDAYDNGITLSEGQCVEKALSQLLGLFNPTWLEKETTDEAFAVAVEVADILFYRMVINLIARVRSEEAIEEAIKEAKSHYIVLDKYLPWKGIVVNSKQPKASEIWYVIYPSSRGGYCVQCVPKGIDTFEQRHSVPEEWKGNPEATGIEDCTFVHPTGFLAVIKSLSGALRYVTLAMGEEAEEAENPLESTDVKF